MKQEYIEPSIETVVIDDLLQGEVINPGTIPEGADADSKRNSLEFDEKTEITPHQKSLWDE